MAVMANVKKGVAIHIARSVRPGTQRVCICVRDILFLLSLSVNCIPEPYLDILSVVSHTANTDTV